MRNGGGKRLLNHFDLKCDILCRTPCSPIKLSRNMSGVEKEKESQGRNNNTTSEVTVLSPAHLCYCTLYCFFCLAVFLTTSISEYLGPTSAT